MDLPEPPWRSSRRRPAREPLSREKIVDTALTLLYESALDESRRDAAMAAFAKAFDAPQSIRMRFDFDRHELSEFHAHGHDSGVLGRYADYYHGIDPGGPPAGQFWVEYALGLARQAQ